MVTRCPEEHLTVAGMVKGEGSIGTHGQSRDVHRHDRYVLLKGGKKWFRVREDALAGWVP